MSYNIYLGNNIVDNIYLGNTEITEADLLGSNLNSFDLAKPFEFISDGTIVGSQLIDLSGNNRHATMSNNILTDANFEFGQTMPEWSGTVCQTKEYVTSESHSGTKSLHIISTGASVGIYFPNKFATKTGEEITVSFWIKRVTNVTARTSIRKGNDSGVAATNDNSGATGVWTNITFSYTETAGGDKAYVAFYQIVAGTFEYYIDDFSVSVTGLPNLGVTMPNDTMLKALDTTNYFYNSIGIPLTKRTDLPTLFSAKTDKVFHGISNKIIFKSGQISAKSLDAILKYCGDTTVTVTHFTSSRIIIPTNASKHFGFGSMIFIGNRMYSFYREGRSHDSYDGVMKSVYSDNYGASWSSPVTVYTGAEIFTNNPSIKTNDPLATSDVRMCRPIITADGYLGIYTVVDFGHPLSPYPSIDCDTRIHDASYYTFLKIPINGLELDYNSIGFYYLKNKIYGSSTQNIILKEGVLYAGVFDINLDLYTSSDNGLTWTKKSNIFMEEGVEVYLSFSGNTLYAIMRNSLSASASFVKKSLDNGATWSASASITENFAGADFITMSDGRTLWIGRDQNQPQIAMVKLSDTTLVNDLTNILAFTTSDCAHGNIVLHNGVYYISFHDGPLKSAPNKNGQSSAAFQFKEIVQKWIEDF